MTNRPFRELEPIGGSADQIRGIARPIAGAVLAEPGDASAVVEEVLTWALANAGEIAGHVTAWVAAQSVERSLAAVTAGRPTALRPDQLSTLTGLPVAAQVSVALHHFVRMSVEDVAAATSRTVEEVRRLVGAPEPAPAPAAEPAPAPTGAVAPPAPPVPSVPPAPPVAPAPPVPPPLPPRAPVVPPPGPLFPAPAPTAREAPEATEAATGGSIDPGAGDGPPAPPPATPPAEPAPERVRVRKRVTSRRRKVLTRPVTIAALVVLALITVGIVAGQVRSDRPRERSSGPGGVADALTIGREQMSPGCRTRKGDAAVEPELVKVPWQGGSRVYRRTAAAPLNEGVPRPLLIAFGDLGQSVDEQVAASNLDQLAVALKLVVVTIGPAAGFEQWNVADANGDPDDIGFVSKVVEQEAKRLCVDQTRIVATGLGAGAHFAAAYACANPGVVDGLVLVAGVRLPPKCPSAARFSVLAVLGSADDVYPLSGGTGPGHEALVAQSDGLESGAEYTVPPAQDALDDLAEHLDCEGTASMPLGLATIRIATSCTSDDEVWHTVLEGAPHQWFGATNDLVVRFMTAEGPLGPRES